MAADRGIVVLVVHWVVCIFPSTLFILSRCLVRKYHPEMFNLASDIFIGLAYLFQLMNSVFITLSYTLGNFAVAKSISHVDLGATVLSVKVAWISVNMFFTALFAIKAAVLAMYSPLIPRESRLHRAAFNSLCGLVLGSFIVVSLLNTVTCLPVSQIWAMESTTTGRAQCFPASLPWVLTISAVLHITTDLALFLLPFPLLVSLWKGGDVSRRSMIGLVSIFSVGFICVLATILRIISATNQTDGVAKVACWSAVELMTGVLVACFPAFRVMVRKGTGHSIWGRLTTRINASRGDESFCDEESHNISSLSSNPPSRKESGTHHTVEVMRSSKTPRATVVAFSETEKNESGKGLITPKVKALGSRPAGESFEIATETKRGTLKAGMIVWDGEERNKNFWDEITMEDIEIDMEELGAPRECHTCT